MPYLISRWRSASGRSPKLESSAKNQSASPHRRRAFGHPLSYIRQRARSKRCRSLRPAVPTQGVVETAL